MRGFIGAGNMNTDLGVYDAVKRDTELHVSWRGSPLRERTSHRMFRRFLKVSLIVLVCVVLASLWAHKPRPELTQGPEADALAQRVVNATGAEAWRSLKRVVFNFRGGRYEWHVQEQVVWIGDAPERIILDLQTKSCRGETPAVEVSESACRYRTARWNNDSFWLNPFGKLFDPGVDRGLCTIQQGAPPWLCVRFNSGGDTPGDLYAIHVGPDERPTAWRMWVKILPIGGVHAVWDQWREIPGGAWFAGLRYVSAYTVPVELIQVDP